MEQKSKYDIEIENFRHNFRSIKTRELQYMEWEGVVQRFFQG